MFGKTWSHNVLRKYVILFGTVFNDFFITRDNASGEVVKTLKVPLSYGPKEKMLARLEMNPQLDNQIAISLPRMSFEMISFQYDPERKLNTMNRFRKQDGDNTNYQYMPVPYNIQFQLSIFVKNAEDGTKIIEQILPYFTPEWTASVNLIPDIDGKFDIPIILNDISLEDTYEGSFEQRRAIIWTLNFTMKAYVFGPTKKIRPGGTGTSADVIKRADINMRATDDVDTANTTNTSTGVTVLVKPGLTANGTPTSKSSESIDYLSINADDDYGFITEYSEDL